MSDAKPVKCQKCGNPIGYVTVAARGISPFQQPVPNVKIVAVNSALITRKQRPSKKFNDDENMQTQTRLIMVKKL